MIQLDSDEKDHCSVVDCTEEIFDQLGVGIVTYEGNLVNEIVGLCHYHYVEIVNDGGEGI